jgi:hypothetical protein
VAPSADRFYEHHFCSSIRGRISRQTSFRRSSANSISSISRLVGSSSDLSSPRKRAMLSRSANSSIGTSGGLPTFTRRSQRCYLAPDKGRWNSPGPRRGGSVHTNRACQPQNLSILIAFLVDFAAPSQRIPDIFVRRPQIAIASSCSNLTPDWRPAARLCWRHHINFASTATDASTGRNAAQGVRRRSRRRSLLTQFHCRLVAICQYPARMAPRTRISGAMPPRFLSRKEQLQSVNAFSAAKEMSPSMRAGPVEASLP